MSPSSSSEYTFSKWRLQKPPSHPPYSWVTWPNDYPRIMSISRSSEKIQMPPPSAIDINVESPTVKPRNDVKQTVRDMKSGIAWHG